MADTSQRDSSFPKARRLLRSKEFRKVYDEGFRVTGPLFAAFCRQEAGQEGPRVGFTVPRAVGKAVRRNRIKRRLREAVRRQLGQLGPQWQVVFNPRRPAHDAPFEQVLREVERVFSQCRARSGGR